MATPDYVQWLERGRAHQREGRAIDAMLCYRRAARADPRASDPHFVLGEVLWQLGRPTEAIMAWRESLRLAPAHLAPAQALAEALLATDESAAARAAAERVLALAPGDARATLIRAIATMATDGQSPEDESFALAAHTLEHEPQFLAVPALAGPLAKALDAAPRTHRRESLLEALARFPEVLAAAPSLLTTLALEHLAGAAGANAMEMRDALVAQACERSYADADREALRRSAVAVALFDRGGGNVLAERYAALCATTFVAPVPLTWPRRTAGLRRRIVLLLPADVSTVAEVHDFAALSPDAFDVALAAIGAAAAPSVAGLTGVALPPEPDAVAAKVIAARDPDVLVDLVGLAAASGPLLALRPARAVFTLATLPLPNRAPLVDRAFGDVAEVLAALAAIESAGDPSRDCPVDVAVLDATWESAVRAHQSGDRAAAIAQYQSVLQLQPGFATAWFLSGVARRDGGDVGGAREAFAAALTAAPGYGDARIAAARAALAMRDAAASIALAGDGLAMSPGDARLWRVLGEARLAQHDGSGAAMAFDAALRIDANDGEGHYRHGVALQMQGELGEAARAYQRALALRPDLTAAHFNLGVLFQAQGSADAAIAAYGEVLSADPGNVAAYKNLGEALLAAGRIDAWLANFRRFEARCPTALPLAVQALEACQHLGDFAALERYLDGLAQERFVADDDAQLVDSLEELLYLLLFFDVPLEVIDRCARMYDTAARRVYGEPLPRSATRKPGRLRVGYLSADLRDHVMGKMAWSAVEHHDKERFELHFYSLSAVNDDWTARFRGLANRFEVVAALDERTAASRIADDDLDILVDLSTHTRGAKPGILALKPARVQITHVASAGTVGLSTVDFKLTDRYCDVPEAQAFQIEKLLPMEGCVYPYRHVAPAETHALGRAELGLAEDAVVIGAFVAGLKLSRRCLSLWRDVLARVPRAKLAFSPLNPALTAMYERLAAAAGISRDRLLLVPQGRNEAENRARYALVDFVLDPMPFGGVNGTLEALDMGVPVVTLLGKRHGERTSYSILANLGVTDTVASSGREYVDLAARLADDAAFLEGVRARIREGLADSALTDMPAHTRALERAYIVALAARAPEALATVERSCDG